MSVVPLLYFHLAPTLSTVKSVSMSMNLCVCGDLFYRIHLGVGENGTNNKNDDDARCPFCRLTSLIDSWASASIRCTVVYTTRRSCCRCELFGSVGGCQIGCHGQGNECSKYKIGQQTCPILCGCSPLADTLPLRLKNCESP